MPEFDDIDEILLPSVLAVKRQGVAQPVEIIVIRELDEADLPTLLSSEESRRVEQTSGSSLSRVRSTHHMLAQLCAEGKSNVEVAAIAGYSPGYISALRADPAFKELLAHYGQVREKLFVDVLERMKYLGLTSLEELQQRLAEEPEKFTRQELMQMAEMLLIKPAAALGAKTPVAAPNISIKFITSSESGGASPSTAPVIDVTPSEAAE